jgi:hypothetical protein
MLWRGEQKQEFGLLAQNNRLSITQVIKVMGHEMWWDYYRKVGYHNLLAGDVGCEKLIGCPIDYKFRGILLSRMMVFLDYNYIMALLVNLRILHCTDYIFMVFQGK